MTFAMDDENSGDSEPAKIVVEAGAAASFAAGSCTAIALDGGKELALYNVNGEFYASDNLCPHQGAPLAAGDICGHVIECFLHGWQFDVRTGECLTVPEKIETYEVLVEEGLVKIVL
jgi:3-phenylpropionate/trans-cinnamate dioxygenase ferredoxin component